MTTLEMIGWTVFLLAFVVGPIALLLGIFRLLKSRNRNSAPGRPLPWKPFLFSGLLIIVLAAMGALIVFRGEAPKKNSPDSSPPDTQDTSSPPEQAQPTPRPLPTPSPIPRGSANRRKNYAEVEVLYATDRSVTGSSEPAKYFGTKRSKKLHWGTCKVSIPRDHAMGELEAPKWYFFQFSPDPDKHVVLMKVSPLEAGPFASLLRRRLGEARRPEVLVFIHGFNVTFEDAARRTAQLAYDLGQEIPIFYSWPSKGQEESYPADEATAEWTIPNLVKFLEQVTQVTGTQKINVIAHSMGNRALVRALLQYSDRHPKSRFRNLVFTAPDIDADTFQDLAHNFSQLADRSTLYASARDKAITLSRVLHEAPRAGDAGKHLLVVDGVDTIDATSVQTDFLDHSYYGDSRTLISDMFYLIRQGAPPGERSGLEERSFQGRRYWMFKP